MTVREIVDQVRLMGPAERAELLHELIDLINEPAPEEKQYGLLDLDGIALHLADGIDAQEYVNRLRSEWDHRP